jgi:ribonuclease P protein component
MKVLGFPKSSRLLTPRDYARVFDDVQIRVPHRNFLILATSNSENHARIGLVFSKKNLKLAVQRNRIKRRIRETFRLYPELPPLDIVVLGRRGLADIDNPALNAMMDDLWSRLKRKHRHITTTVSERPPKGSKGTG